MTIGALESRQNRHMLDCPVEKNWRGRRHRDEKMPPTPVPVTFW